MATNKQLQAEIEGLRQLLAQRGITEVIQPVTDPTERADYIGFGSPEYAAFLGLIEVDDVEKALKDEHIVYTSSETGKTYRLEDEVTAFVHTADPRQVARLTLMQKVSSFESGSPQVPKDAPPMWEPIDYVPAR